MAEDEACFGRLSIPRRAWAPPGVRPHAPQQRIREYTYVYAAVAPAEGKMTSLILPSADTEMMNFFLEHVSKTYEKYFVVMQVDQASWHGAKDLRIPAHYSAHCSACLQSRAQSGGTHLGRTARKTACESGSFLTR